MNTEQLAARVERLERGMRRLRRLTTVLVVGLVVGLVAWWGKDEIPDVVKARKFEVVNEAGTPVVKVTSDEDGRGFVHVCNKGGDRVVGLGVMHGSGVVVTWNMFNERLWRSY